MVTVAGQVEKLFHLGVIVTQNLFLTSQPNRLMEQKYDTVMYLADSIYGEPKTVQKPMG